MSSKTINSEMLEKFEEQILSYAGNGDWARELGTVNDMLCDYLLDDENYMGNRETSNTMYHLRHLRDFFKDLDDLAH